MIEAKLQQSAAANSMPCQQELYSSSSLSLNFDLSQLNNYKRTLKGNKSMNTLQNTQGLVTIYRKNIDDKTEPITTREEGQRKAILELANTQKMINFDKQPLMKKILIQEAYDGLLSIEMAQLTQYFSSKNIHNVVQLGSKVLEHKGLLTIVKYLIEIVDKQSDSFVNNAILAYQVEIPQMNPFSQAAALHNAINISVLDHKPPKMLFVNLSGIETTHNLEIWQNISVKENYQYYTFIPQHQYQDLCKFNSNCITIIPVVLMDDKLRKYQLQILYEYMVVRDINRFNPAIIYLSLGNNECFPIDFEAIDFIVKELVKLSNNRLIVHCQDYNEDSNKDEVVEILEQQYLQLYNCIIQAMQSLPYQGSDIVELQSKQQRESRIKGMNELIANLKVYSNPIGDTTDIIEEMQKLQWSLEAVYPSYSTISCQPGQDIIQHTNQQEVVSCFTLPYFKSGQIYHIQLQFKNTQILFLPQSKYVVSYEHNLVYLHNCYLKSNIENYNYTVKDLMCFYIRCMDIDAAISNYSENSDLKLKEIYWMEIPNGLENISNQQFLIGDDSIYWIYGEKDGVFNDQIHVYKTYANVWTTLKRKVPHNWKTKQVLNNNQLSINTEDTKEIIENRLNPTVCTDSLISTQSQESFMLIGGENTKFYQQMNIIEVVQISLQDKSFSSAIVNKQNFGLYHSIRSMPNIPVLSTVQNGVSYILILPGNKSLSRQPYNVLENQFTYENAMLFITESSSNQITQNLVKIKHDSQDVDIFSLFNNNQWNCIKLQDKQQNTLNWKLIFQSVNYKRGILKKNINVSSKQMDVELNLIDLENKKIVEQVEIVEKQGKVQNIKSLTQDESQEIQQYKCESTSSGIQEAKSSQIQAKQISVPQEQPTQTQLAVGQYSLDDHQIFTHCFEMNISLYKIDDTQSQQIGDQYKYECFISLGISEIGNKIKFQQTNLIDILAKQEIPS